MKKPAPEQSAAGFFVLVRLAVGSPVEHFLQGNDQRKTTLSLWELPEVTTVAKASFLTHRIPDRAQAPRGYAAKDAPRLLHWDAERLGRRYPAERGNDQQCGIRGP